jgi:hypothetical protein
MKIAYIQKRFNRQSLSIIEQQLISATIDEYTDRELWDAAQDEEHDARCNMWQKLSD